MKEEDIKSTIKFFMTRALFSLEQIDKLIDKYHLKNEQFVLDFYDKVNEISVRK